MNVIKDVAFFIPRIKKSKLEATYDTMKKDVKYQLRWTVSDRRIESITYVSNRKKLTARIGEVGVIEHHHEVIAIMEAAVYIILTVDKNGEPGPTVLVDVKDVLAINDFKIAVPKVAPLLAAL